MISNSNMNKNIYINNLIIINKNNKTIKTNYNYIKYQYSTNNKIAFNDI